MACWASRIHFRITYPQRHLVVGHWGEAVDRTTCPIRGDLACFCVGSVCRCQEVIGAGRRVCSPYQTYLGIADGSHLEVGY